jgi:hypothetical protein
VLSTYAPHSIS